MRLKSFHAKTMSEAMNMVREALGDDAVIVATREERGGSAVRVTAAIDPAFEVSQNGQAAEADDWLQYDSEEEEGAIAEELTDVLLRHNTPEDVTDNIISCATVIGLENPGVALVAAIEHLFHFRPLPEQAHNKPIMMVGPPGAGKTLAVAKLAARSSMNGLKVGVISCDTVRAGGIEQLRAFTDILQIDLKKAGTPEDLKQIIKRIQPCDQIIVDSPAINPFDKNDLNTIADFINAADVDPHLVLAAGSDSEESAETAKAFSKVGVHTLVSTRIDIAKRLGGLLAAAHSGALAFADAGNTPKVADGLLQVTPRSLARMLMPSAYQDTALRRTRKTGTR